MKLINLLNLSLNLNLIFYRFLTNFILLFDFYYNWIYDIGIKYLGLGLVRLIKLINLEVFL